MTKGGKGIIFGSEANNRIYMRSPLDVVQIGRLLGMQPSDAKKAISANCKSCLQHAAYRKTHKGVALVGTNQAEFEESDDDEDMEENE